MRVYTLSFIFICISAIAALAQGEKNSLKGVPFNERIVIGGGLGGLSFGSAQDYIQVSPSIGYMITRKFMGGVSLTYQYSKYKFVRPSITTHGYGAAPFLRYVVFKNIFLQTEYEYLNYGYVNSNRSETRFEYKNFLAGGGFVQPLGKRSAIYFTALYNFSYNDNQVGPYSSPLIIRAGISAGMFGSN